jgi:hypothetical protein
MTEEVAVLVQVILGIAVLALLIYRQLLARPVNASVLRLTVILGGIGLLETYQFLAGHHADAVTYAAIGGSLLLAAFFGGLRAVTVRVWSDGGQAWSKGSWLTAGLWIAALAAHLGYDALVADGHGNKGLGSATVLLYLAVSLGIQRLIVLQRAHRLPHGGPAPLSRAGRFS